MNRKFSIIYLLFLCLSLSAAEDIKIISSSSSSILIEYKVIYSDTSEITLDGSRFFRAEILNGIYDAPVDRSAPQIPFRILTVGVPSEFGNTITVLNGEFERQSGQIVPFPSTVRKNELVDYRYETGSGYREYVQPELVNFDEFGLFRDLPVQKIRINPVQFDPSANEIKLYTKIRFRINFSRPVDQTYRVTEELQDAVINFDIAKNWGVKNRIKQLFKAAQNSVLATGTWYRFEAPEEGIYRIDRAFLSSIGINPDNVDPRTIKIYNNGGYQLPEDVTADRPVDLEENAILVVGEEDGSFNTNDYILFYGRGTDFFEYNTADSDVVRRKHDFSKKNYYYITSGGGEGKRIQTQQSLDDPNAYQQQTTRSFLFHEEDLTNIGQTGRDYWGEVFNSATNSHTFINSLDERVPGSSIDYKFRAANTTSVGTPNDFNFSVQENSTNIYTTIARGWANQFNGEYILGNDFTGTTNYTGNLQDYRSTLKFTISNNGSNSQAHLDYFEIEYEKYLRAMNDELIFYSEDRGGPVEYDLGNFSNSNIRVFDITEHDNVKEISPNTLSGGQFIFQAEEEQNNVSKYLALTTSNYKTPVNPESVVNSNIRGIQDGVKYVIIANKKFSQQANRLATYRSSQAYSTISTLVVYIDEIYNEFSCGSLDPTALRDFLSHAYQNWTTPPELVLLFGDGDYDYFNTEDKSANYIPTYQTKQSLSELTSFPMDDYYSRISGDDRFPEVGIGRLNVNTPAEADIAVTKIIEYESQSEYGIWRNSITLVADDGPTSEGNDGATHTNQSESLSKNKIPEYFNQDKIYLPAYPTLVTGAGRRKPAVNQAIIDAVNNGTLIVNFIGHGNPDLWTHENVFSKDVSIPQLNNDKLFFLSAATCDFGKYDVPDDASATELMMLKESGGLIGAFTASRPVYSQLNAALNNIFFTNLLGERDSEGLPRRIGYSYMLTKFEGTSQISNDQKFHLFGDPALRLNEPSLPVDIDSINEKQLDVAVQLSALGEVKIKGSVKDENGNLNTDFNGETILSVFDSERDLVIEEDRTTYRMEVRGGVIFRGRASVNSGEFETVFTVPKDISYENKNGKVVAYSFNQNIDGVGFTDKVIIGGTDSTAVNDGDGPDIEIYFDDLSFESSYLVNSDFNLLVKLEDETGINTTGTGVGHKLEGIVDGDENNAIDFTSYFVGDLDAGGKSGLIDYRFSDFDEGDHKIEIKAWDVFNNTATAETFFTVVNSDDLVIREVVNYPNPFSSNTTFTFQQNLNKPLNVKVKVYTIAGRLIKEIESFNILEKFVRIPWDGRDEDGSILANGTYLYKLIVESTDGEYKETVLGKLAVIK